MSSHAHAVLIVEDDPDVREAIAMLLELHESRAHTACDGREALDALRSGLRPCLILLDLQMPRMDGLAFRREQRADPELRDIPVAVLSALPRLHERTEPLAVAASIQKPVEPDRLLAIISEHCAVALAEGMLRERKTNP